MSYSRNGREIFCCACGKRKPADGAAKEANGHRKICAECKAREAEKPTEGEE